MVEKSLGGSSSLNIRHLFGDSPSTPSVKTYSAKPGPRRRPSRPRLFPGCCCCPPQCAQAGTIPANPSGRL